MHRPRARLLRGQTAFDRFRQRGPEKVAHGELARTALRAGEVVGVEPRPGVLDRPVDRNEPRGGMDERLFRRRDRIAPLRLRRSRDRQFLDQPEPIGERMDEFFALIGRRRPMPWMISTCRGWFWASGSISAVMPFKRIGAEDHRRRQRGAARKKRKDRRDQNRAPGSHSAPNIMRSTPPRSFTKLVALKLRVLSTGRVAPQRSCIMWFPAADQSAEAARRPSGGGRLPGVRLVSEVRAQIQVGCA